MLLRLLTRLFAVLPVVLVFGALVSSAPVSTETHVTSCGDTCFANRASGGSIYSILTQLRFDLNKECDLVDEHLKAGTNPIEAFKAIISDFNVAAAKINNLPKGMASLPDGKGPEVVKAWTGILTDFTTRSAKWQGHRTRAIGDIFAGLSMQIGGAVSAAQGALTGALGGLQTLGSQILDASKPHWEQLQEQLVGHGLNALGSLLETINNVHGSVIGDRSTT
ncbi:hypothetical protein RhiXN_05460 [Rhizoctonia solani]|uniref:Secreted protein n=1 Tax=Rhizoctonia solani TaxID=456999 RepID=A0A8H7LYW7_9AGAM|nr:uncharacterized protein RhiXN_05460 [Rhizoctonia solani]KAF8751603.1 hypothetical protein RHS01_08306 [Rhizoctonia solani]QRW17458.1 hypothetical protein RhiXN_05460 [Rhizoctonia solani]